MCLKGSRTESRIWEVEMSVGPEKQECIGTNLTGSLRIQTMTECDRMDP